MTQINSLTCAPPFCNKEMREEVTASLWIRIGTIAFGVIGITIGVLILYKIPGLHHLGTTTGKVAIPIGVCLIGVATLFRYVKNFTPEIPISPLQDPETMPQPPQIKWQAQEMTIFEGTKVPVDIWKIIFSFFKPRELLNCQRVCKNWFVFANSDELWKIHCSRIMNDFSSAVQMNLCSWKVVYTRYSPLSCLFSQIIEGSVCEKNNEVVAYNPQLKNQSFPTLCLPRFFVHYGRFRFFISNLSQILVQKDHVVSRILTDEMGTGFTHLAVQNEMVFALRKDGLIIQWNYITGERTQEIESAGSKSDRRVQKVLNDGAELVVWREGFTVSEGYILLKYGDARHHICEAISYENPTQRQLIVNKNVDSDAMLVKENKLYLMRSSSIFVWDLDKKEEVKFLNRDVIDDSYYLMDMKIIKDKLYLTSCDAEIYMHDINNGKEAKAYQIPSEADEFTHIAVIGSILFGFSSYDENGECCEAGTLWAYDLLSEKTLGTINKVMNLATYEIEPHVVPKIIEISQGRLLTTSPSVAEPFTLEATGA